MPRIVVLGAGTGVGKTWVTGALAQALGGRVGFPAILALKPVESGIPPGSMRVGLGAPAGSDAAALEIACERSGRILPHPRYGFPDPVSPHLAARRANETIEISVITAWVRHQEQAALAPEGKLWCLVETAGGAFSPLSNESTNADLALALKPDRVLLVGADRLGVLHDLGATVIALSNRGLTVDHIILSEAAPRDASTGANARELHELRATLRLGETRIWSVPRDQSEQVGALAECLQADSG